MSTPTTELANGTPLETELIAEAAWDPEATASVIRVDAAKRLVTILMESTDPVAAAVFNSPSNCVLPV